MAELTEKQKAINATTEAVEEKVAILIKQKYALLKAAFQALPDSKEVKDADFMQMAKNAIDGEALHGEITLDKIQIKINEIGGADLVMQSLGAKSINELVPNREQVNKIANAVGEGVEDNTSFGVTGARNWISKHWPWTDSGKEAIALRVENSVRTKLVALRTNDNTMTALLTDVNIEQISNAAKERAKNPNAPKQNLLGSTKIEDPSDAVLNNIGNAIYLQTYDATKNGINSKIEEEYQKNGFIGSIAKFLGPDMANMLIGFLNFFITMFNGKGYALIPSEAEVNNASNVVANSVRSVLTDKWQDKPQCPETANTAVKEAVRQNLEANKQHYPSLTPEQMDEISEKAGKGAEDNFNKIFPTASTSHCSIEASYNQYRSGHDPNLPDYQGMATNGGVIRRDSSQVRDVC